MNNRDRLVGPDRLTVASLRLRFAAALVLAALAMLAVAGALMAFV